MLPSDAYFAKTIGGLGISNSDHIVAYDGKGIFSAARLWWMLRAYGHEEVSVLNGGLPAFLPAGLAFWWLVLVPPPPCRPTFSGLGDNIPSSIRRALSVMRLADKAFCEVGSYVTLPCLPVK